jgi:hypothetical protein
VSFLTARSLSSSVTKACYRCGATAPEAVFNVDRSKKDGLSIYCRDCLIEKRRAEYQKHREKNIARVRAYQATDAGKATMKRGDDKKRQSPQYRARSMVWNRVRRKQWPNASLFLCSDCGAVKAEHYHHEDYSKPLSVEPLCETCHLIRHGKSPRPSRLSA